MFDFLQNLDNDIRDALLAQLRNLWTHTSTAIEGNTLSLGETAFVLEEGLAISGKPLKDHEEIVGHARAIDLVYDLIRRESDLTEKDLFDLHKGPYRPNGFLMSISLLVHGKQNRTPRLLSPAIPRQFLNLLSQRMYRNSCKAGLPCFKKPVKKMRQTKRRY